MPWWPCLSLLNNNNMRLLTLAGWSRGPLYLCGKQSPNEALNQTCWWQERHVSSLLCSFCTRRTSSRLVMCSYWRNKHHFTGCFRVCRLQRAAAGNKWCSRSLLWRQTAAGNRPHLLWNWGQSSHKVCFVGDANTLWHLMSSPASLSVVSNGCLQWKRNCFLRSALLLSAGDWCREKQASAVTGRVPAEKNDRDRREHRN